MKTKAIKLLEENAGEIFYNIRFGIGFLDRIRKAKGTKENIEKSEYTKIKLCIKGHKEQSEWQPMEREKYIQIICMVKG